MNEWMKNLNRHSSHGHHGSHAFTHTLPSTQLQPRGMKRKLTYYSSVHAESFRVSIIHWTLTWTTGYFSRVHDHSFVCVYTQGLGTPTASQRNSFDSEKIKNISYAPDGIWTSVLWISSLTLYQVSHPVAPWWRKSSCCRSGWKPKGQTEVSVSKFTFFVV